MQLSQCSAVTTMRIGLSEPMPVNMNIFLGCNMGTLEGLTRVVVVDMKDWSWPCREDPETREEYQQR